MCIRDRDYVESGLSRVFLPLLRQQSTVVLVTNHARHLPYTIFVLPKRHKLRVPHTILRVSRVVEAMYADLHRSISLQRVNLQRVRE